jgi:AraC-like DNA-binding protein
MGHVITDGYRKRTADHRPGERFAYWCDFICDEFVKLDCEHRGKQDFDGELRGGVGIGKLRFSEVISDAQLVTRSRRQIARSGEADFLISFQLAQQGLIQQSGRRAVLNPGSFALYDSTEPYSLTFSERFHQFVVQMPKDVLSRHLINPEQYTAIAVSGNSGLGSVLSTFLFSLMRELDTVQRAPGELAENLVNMIALAFSSSVMLEQVGEQSVAREAIKRRIRQYIDNNLCDPQLCNNHIAAAQNISIRYLHKLFQDEEETLHTLILHRRLEKSHQLLADPAYCGHSIENIAYSVGFSSPAHFSRAFKKRYGVSPSEVRGLS